MKTLGERLRKARELKGMSVSEVARHLNVSPSTYREWEYGRDIKGEPYSAICSLFDISYSFLFTGEKVRIENFLEEIEIQIKKIRSFL